MAAGERKRVLDEIEELGWPVFVKPARAGSSMGITRVDDRGRLEAAVEDAREHDPKVIVEAAIEGREIECGVLEGLDDDPPDASLPAEVAVGSGHDYYDFEAKYLDEGLRLDIPAGPAARRSTEEVRKLSVRRSRRSAARAWPGSTSSTPPTAACWSTRSTPCPAAPRRPPSRRCGRPPGWTTRHWSTGGSVPRSRAVPGLR